MEGSYQALNDILVVLFNDIMDIEQEAIITGEFRDITNNDMHIIEAVGVDEPQNMSSIAKKLSVTMGTLTISMNNLVKKGYVVRQRSEEDRRVVYILLTDKGGRRCGNRPRPGPLRAFHFDYDQPCQQRDHW